MIRRTGDHQTHNTAVVRLKPHFGRQVIQRGLLLEVKRYVERLSLACRDYRCAMFAYLGVLRALEEGRLEIDLIGGTSMGSLVGGVYATDRELDRCVELAERFSNPKRLFDYTLPLTSIMASR